ncbi:hypothetical protein LTR10_001653 [Elasticomyces elasticus]|nr:hypothetical protein LTR10_001653 [Elasticomyces elasticus]KAK4975156.1 hypothetical protein LTR42_004366 [Elasticomyces elasticus]
MHVVLYGLRAVEVHIRHCFTIRSLLTASRSAEDNGKSKDRIKYWTWLAQLAERGKISAIFIADWYVGFDVYGGSLDACLKAGHQVAHLDPVPLIAAMAAVTSSVSFAPTISTTYVKPYILARQLSTLDHVTEGRCGWNIVTSHTNSSAQALGFDEIIAHDERYAMAEEYMDIVYKLWESSWADDSVVWAEDLAYDPEKIKRIEHKGKYFSVMGRSQVHPSPQRTPVLFQAGTSKSGTAFAARHAEAIFMNPSTTKLCKSQIAAARAEATSQGRDPATLKFFPCIVPIIGRTEVEAKAKQAKAKGHGDMIGGLAQFAGYTGIDMSLFPLDEPFSASSVKGGAAIQAVLSSFEASVEDSEPWTPRRLGERMALGGLHPSPVGSAEQVADFFEHWINETDCDGFNVAYVSNPGSFEDVVDLLVPELQKRGIMWQDYAKPEGTFRENLLGHPRLAEDHYGSKFKYGRDPSLVSNLGNGESNGCSDLKESVAKQDTEPTLSAKGVPLVNGKSH